MSSLEFTYKIMVLLFFPSLQAQDINKHPLNFHSFTCGFGADFVFSTSSFKKDSLILYLERGLYPTSYWPIASTSPYSYLTWIHQMEFLLHMQIYIHTLSLCQAFLKIISLMFWKCKFFPRIKVSSGLIWFVALSIGSMDLWDLDPMDSLQCHFLINIHIVNTNIHM